MVSQKQVFSVKSVMTKQIGKFMTFSLFSRVILTQDIPEENLLAGDTGTIVEYHPATDDYPEGYEVEFFAGNGETLAVVSVPATALRAATRKDVLHARQLIAA
jgi:hypothetical protein